MSSAPKNSSPSQEEKYRELFSEIRSQYAASRENLIPILQDIQKHTGYIPGILVDELAQYLDLSINDIYGVATFYRQFRFTPPGKHVIRICMGTACHVKRSQLILESVCKKLNVAPGEVTPDGKISVERLACYGACALAPAVVIDGKVHARMTPDKIEKEMNKLL